MRFEFGKTYLLLSKYGKDQWVASPWEDYYWVEPIEEYLGEECWDWGGTIPTETLKEEIEQGEFTIIKVMMGEDDEE